MDIYGSEVRLRAVEKRDMEFLRGMLNDPEIEKSVVGWSFPVSETRQEAWYEKNCGDERNQRFIIEDSVRSAVGLITLMNIDWKNRKADTGIKLIGSSRGRGLGRDAMLAVMRYAFEELQLHRLDCCWLEDNAASRALHVNYGWKIEGVRKDAVFKGGTYKNLVMAGVLKSDYEELARRLPHLGGDRRDG